MSIPDSRLVKNWTDKTAAVLEGRTIVRVRYITEDEMRRVFNLGIGFVFVVAPEDIRGVTAMLQDLGESPVVIGDVIS